MKTPELDRQDTPPPAKNVLWVERLRGNERGTFTVYSQCLWGVNTHYHNGRTQPCFKNHDLCFGGHKVTNLRWKGYLHCWGYSRNRQVILQLTDAGARMLLKQVAQGAVLRGLTLEVARTSKDKGRLNVKVDHYALNKADRLPPEIDPLPSLWNLWGIDPSVELVNRKLIVDPAEIPESREAA